MKWTAQKYSEISKALQAVIIVVFIILCLLAAIYAEAHVDLIDTRSPDINQLEATVRDKENYEAYQRECDGSASERDKEKADQWQSDHMS